MRPPELPERSCRLAFSGTGPPNANAVRPCLRKRFVCIRPHKPGGTGDVL